MGKENASEENEVEDNNNQFDKDQKFAHSKKKAEISEDEVVATALVMLVAGYDTTGMTLTYLAYAMSQNPDIQQKLQAEVDQAFEDNNGEMPDYNVIQSLPYIDMVLHETLRKYNPVSLNEVVHPRLPDSWHRHHSEERRPYLFLSKRLQETRTPASGCGSPCWRPRLRSWPPGGGSPSRRARRPWNRWRWSRTVRLGTPREGCGPRWLRESRD